jgi:hypothetical protein
MSRRAEPADGRGANAATVERHVREVMDGAGIQGLCREGRIEAAVGAVRALRPDWSAATALAFVQRVAAKAES